MEVKDFKTVHWKTVIINFFKDFSKDKHSDLKLRRRLKGCLPPCSVAQVSCEQRKIDSSFQPFKVFAPSSFNGLIAKYTNWCRIYIVKNTYLVLFR